MSTSNEMKIEYYDRVLNIEDKSPEILAMLSEEFVNDHEKHAMIWQSSPKGVRERV